jgi:radical SAM superfamily enzyme YgiQ (UPF0313 family)
MIFLDKPPIIRPPAEADSLIIQATYGCSHNRCAFCATYQERPFAVRPFEDIAQEINIYAQMCPDVRRVFIGDGDPTVLPGDKLAAILEYIKKKLPGVRRISAYGSPKNFRNKTASDIARLAAAGLTQIYMGFESGDDEVLRRIDKDTEFSEIVDVCAAVHEAGIKISAILILGLGGPKLSARHAENSARLLNETRPRFASALTLVRAPKTPRFEEVFNLPSFRELSPKEILKECRRLIEGIDANGIIFRANHVSNYLALEGTLQKSKPRLLSEIDAALALPDSFLNRPSRHRTL